MSTPKALKIVIVGNHGVGKTALVNKMLNRERSIWGFVTLGSVCEIIRTAHGTYNVWDCIPDKHNTYVNNGLRYSKADCAIVMHDLSDANSFASVGQWITDIQGVSPGARIAVVGNKNDVRGVGTHLYPDYVNYCISVKNDSSEQLVAIIDELCC